MVTSGETPSSLYFDDDPDPEEFEKLKSMNLLGFLQDEVGKDTFDMGQIKVIFRALRLATPTEAIDYLKTNFHELVVFSKDIVLLMEALEQKNPGCFDGLSTSVIAANCAWRWRIITSEYEVCTTSCVSYLSSSRSSFSNDMPNPVLI